MTFDEYVAARGQALVRFAYVLTADAHLAEDLVQTALMKAYRHWAKVTAADHPDAYVRRIVVTTHISWRRKRVHPEHLTDTLPDRAVDGRAADPADRVSERDVLDRAVSALQPRPRAVLVLRHYAGYDDTAIAQVLGCSEGAVRAYASKGAAALRAALGEQALAREER
ncbi:SigE family RNA polymerase sigma factor [Motilibacter deserti]|uniref:SigE family RNA polymerase sigma factor n=1 Tax=Motilibacter deserti TaxID=2714956 RepID=A0ABX0GNE3_9ACTN|nr:SigE family RNA polymerase sigma factor [Motilibacter deserti]